MDPRLQTPEKLFSEENDPSDGMDYQKLAHNYHIARFVLCGVGVLLFLYLIFIRRDMLRTENFQYFLKFLSGDSVTETAFADLSYSVDAEASFALYEGDLAMVSHGKFSLFSPDGTLLLRGDAGNETASLHASGAYLALFAPGGKTVTLYNSFAMRGKISLASPVGAAAVSEGGISAICTIENAGMGLYVYSKNLSLMFSEKFTGKLAFDLAFSPDDRTLALLSLQSAGGGFSTVLTFLDATTGKFGYEYSFPGQKPVSLGFLDATTVYVITDGTLCFFRCDGTKLAEHTIPGKPTAWSAFGDKLLFATENKVFLYRKNGNLSAELSFSYVVTDVSLGKNVVCIATEKSILLYDIALRNLLQEKENGGISALLHSATRDIFYLCYADAIKTLLSEH